MFCGDLSAEAPFIQDRSASCRGIADTNSSTGDGSPCGLSATAALLCDWRSAGRARLFGPPCPRRRETCGLAEPSRALLPWLSMQLRMPLEQGLHAPALRASTSCAPLGARPWLQLQPTALPAAQDGLVPRPPLPRGEPQGARLLHRQRRSGDQQNRCLSCFSYLHTVGRVFVLAIRPFIDLSLENSRSALRGQRSYRTTPRCVPVPGTAIVPGQGPSRPVGESCYAFLALKACLDERLRSVSMLPAHVKPFPRFLQESGV